jgi:hypothetical protein
MNQTKYNQLIMNQTKYNQSDHHATRAIRRQRNEI